MKNNESPSVEELIKDYPIEFRFKWFETDDELALKKFTKNNKHIFMTEAELLNMGFTRIEEIYDHDGNMLTSMVKSQRLQNNINCKKMPGTYEMEQRFSCEDLTLLTG